MGTKRNKATGRTYAYDTRYESTEEQKHRRALRNKARRAALRSGRVSKHDSTDIHHESKSLRGKTKVTSKSRNRSIK